MPRCPICHRRVVAGSRCPADGAGVAGVDAAIAPPKPPAIPGYRVVAAIGGGGFASVWEAEETHRGTLLALKVAHGRTDLEAERLRREGLSLERVGPPAVPQYWGIGRTTDGRPYVALERLVGVTLASTLEQGVGLPSLPWVCRIADDLLCSLEAVHKAGIVHRDLKPENVFLVSQQPSRTCILDFGAMRLTHPDDHPLLTRPGTAIGTPEYMAPEQLRGEPSVTAVTDIYAFGVLLFELVTLRPPFVGDAASTARGHLSLRPPPPSRYAALPDAVERLVASCLEKTPERRPQSASEVRVALRAAVQEDAHGSPELRRRPREEPSLLASHGQPVVLLVLESPADAGLLGASVKRRGGFIARRQHNRYVCVFSALSPDDPAATAVATARELVARTSGGRAAVHACRLLLRTQRRGPPSVAGPPVDRPTSWLPEQWRGIVATLGFAQEHADLVGPAPPNSPGFVPIPLETEATPQQTTAYIGRSDLLERAVATWRRCQQTSTPALLTILAESGLGKTRLAAELERRFRRLQPDARLVVVRATRCDPRRLVRAIAFLAEPPSRPCAVLVDDAHLASDDALDFIEDATAEGNRAPLLVALCANRRLQTMRPRFGARAEAYLCLRLTELGEDETAHLAALLLSPAEYPPGEFLRQLSRRAGGNPRTLTDLVAELKRRGAVYRRSGGSGWGVDTAVLDEVPSSATEQWLATRRLSLLAPELSACVRLCAILGGEFCLAELTAVQEAIDRGSGIGTNLDPEIGLRELVAGGLLVSSGAGHFHFASTSFSEAVVQLVDPTDRASIHGHAAEFWRSRLATQGHRQESALGFAQHAEACGRTAEAARMYAAIGDQAREKHQNVRAESYYSAALRCTSKEDGDCHARAAWGRGKVRCQLNRIAEARDDLRQARAAASLSGDGYAETALLLEEATVCDWAADYTDAAELVEQAKQRLEQSPLPELKARLLAAEGCVHWRRGQVKEAIAKLRPALQRAEADKDLETQVVSQLVLAPALVLAGDVDEAEVIFERVIALCQQVGDHLHLCGAYCNRMFLWSARRNSARALDDLRETIEIARETGHPIPERVATHNLAELLYWAGSFDEARTLAKRAQRLQQRFGEGPVPQDALLLARIAGACGDAPTARELLASMNDDCLGDSAILRWAVLLAVGQADVSRQEVCERAQVVHGEERLEVFWWGARAAMNRAQLDLARALAQEATSLLDDVPIWRDRMEALGRELGGPEKPTQRAEDADTR